MTRTDASPIGFKSRLHSILEGVDSRDPATRIFQCLMVSLILANVAAMIMETVEPFREAYQSTLELIDYCSVVIFSIEYVVRLWACTAASRFSRPIVGRLRYAMTPLALIDLMAVLPFYLPFLHHHVDLRFVRTARLVRLLRLLKLARYTQSFQLFGRAVLARKEQLLCTLLILFVFLLGASSLMYHFEHEEQPEKFASIPESLWWGIITITTVGYGDVSPVTPAGKLVGGIIATMGIVFIALPTAIVVSAFLEDPADKRSCPHCGKPLNLLTDAHDAPESTAAEGVL